MMGGASPQVSAITKVKMAESFVTDDLALFRIGRVLLPGSSFPLQIFKHKTATQDMIVRETQKRGRIGVVFSPEGSTDATLVGCEATIDDLTQLDDGRLIVECTGTRRFKVTELVQTTPYLTAKVSWMDESPIPVKRAESERVSCEVELWKMLQEIVWLCVEVWDKRSWATLLMGDAEQHPLHRYRQASPGQAVGHGTAFTSEVHRCVATVLPKSTSVRRFLRTM